MKKLTVAVFFGGHSPEYSVSLESAYSVISNLNKEKYDVLPVGISQRGKWFFYGGDIEKIKEDRWEEDAASVPAVLSADRGANELIVFRGDSIERKHIDAAFPVMHGNLRGFRLRAAACFRLRSAWTRTAHISWLILRA